MSRASELCRTFGLHLTYCANRQEIEALCRTIRTDALAEAAEVCRKELVSLDCGDETDEAYNRAIAHCMSAIEALQTKEGGAARQRAEAGFDEAACRREFEAWAKSERMVLTMDRPPHYSISEVRHAWYAWLAARRAAPSTGAIPADWQLVPREPTRGMQLAGQQRIPGLHELMRRSVDSFAAGGYPDQEQYWYQPWAFAVVAYKAMLAVAPNPPGGHGDGM